MASMATAKSVNQINAPSIRPFSAPCKRTIYGVNRAVGLHFAEQPRLIAF